MGDLTSFMLYNAFVGGSLVGLSGFFAEVRQRWADGPMVCHLWGVGGYET